MNSLLEEKLMTLSKEAKELYLCNNVQTLDKHPSPIEFLRNYVMKNQPVVLKNGVSHWKALRKWNLDYLSNKIGEKDVTVSFTPNGLADAPAGNCFVLPHDIKMKFKYIVDSLKRNDPFDIPYVQTQNSNFTEEFAELLPDAESHIPWASEALGKSPDAVNIWLGNRHSVTSAHKDHYENLYAVVKGSKTFFLYPPTDLPCFKYNQYIVSRYCKDENNEYHIVCDDVETQLCEVCKKHINNSNDILQEQMKVHKAVHSFLNSSSSTDPCNRFDNKLSLLRSTLYNGDSVCECSCTKVPWISDDPLSNVKSYKFSLSNPLEVTLNPGDLLYLPSLWFHHVRQTDNTIAVNFWYDMEYDIKYNYFKFVESLVSENK